MTSIAQRTDLQNRYDSAAGWWRDKIHKLGYRAAYEDLVGRALDGRRFRTVADVGTGAGDLAASYCKVIGMPVELTLIDNSAAMLAQAKSTVEEVGGSGTAVTAMHAALSDISYNERYELVLCAHLIEHCPNPAEALGQLASLVKPGGTALLVISRPHWCQWIIWLRWQHRWFSEDQVGQMAEAAGVRITERFGLASGPPSRTSMAYAFRKP